ncbi:hypothetical protein ACXYL9_08470 [Qipengyuania sp. CAU 1752]
MQLYKHFAVVTIAITAVVGVFADGEAQNAIASHQAEKAERERLAKAEKASRGNRRLIKSGEDTGGGGSFGPQTSPGFSFAGSDTSNTDSFVIRDAQGASDTPVWLKLGLTKAEWNSLSESEREDLAAGVDPKAPSVAAVEAAASRKLTAASRSRSGGLDASFAGGSDAPGSEF